MPPEEPDQALESQAAGLRGTIHAAILKRTGDADLADDVAQETLLRVLARLRGPGLEDPEKLENFMYRVAANVLHEVRRKADRQTLDNDAIDGAPAVTESQLEHLAHSEEARRLWLALEEMENDDYREILILYFIRQQEKADLCVALGLSARAFTQRLFRAKAALRKRLTEVERRHGLRVVDAADGHD